MNEHTLTIEKADPAVFHNVNNSNFQLIKTLFPKLKLAARGNIIKVFGEENEIDSFEKIFHKLERYCFEHNSLTESVIRTIAKGDAPFEAKPKHIILHGTNGKPILARTKNQQLLVDEYKKNDMIFALGPAGSGKTYTAIALAVHALKSKEVKKIILTRPAVEAGEKLGFLPGDLKEKIDPYLQPLYDALEDMIPGAKLKNFIENKVIEIAPLAYMRGRTLNDAVIILDEAQNTTTNQLKMFMTRLGMRGKMIITGDLTQIDLPRTVTSGLKQAMYILKDIKGIAKVNFDKSDIMRHEVVQRIVDAYDAADAAKAADIKGE